MVHLNYKNSVFVLKRALNFHLYVEVIHVNIVHEMKALKIEHNNICLSNMIVKQHRYHNPALENWVLTQYLQLRHDFFHIYSTPALQ